MKSFKEYLAEGWTTIHSSKDGPGKGESLGKLSKQVHQDCIDYHEKELKKRPKVFEKLNHQALIDYHKDAVHDFEYKEKNPT